MTICPEKLIDTKGNTSGGVARFDVITYNLQSNPELAGVHTYKIREVNTADPTIIYDEHTETVTVNVYQAADPNDASLFLTYADVTYQDEAGSASNGVFRNETKPGNLQITKTIENATAKASAQAFEITVTFTDGYSEPVRVKIGSKAETEMTPQAGKLVFSLKADESALITEIPDKTPYTISEKSLPGWTLTGAVKTTQVDGAAESAEEDVLGSLSGKIVTITTDRVTLTNTYAVSGKNPLQAEKLVEGETPEGQAYSFELYAAADWNESAGEPATGASPLEARGNASVDDDGRSLINFSAISYDADGEYVYYIRELAGDDPTMEYDSRVIKATVTAEDKAGDGTLTFTVSYSGGEGDDQNAFLNVRKPGTLKITKTALNTTDACEGQKFTIRIKLTDKNGNALASQRYNTLVDGANGPRLSTNASGTGSLTIQAGQTVTVLGLPHGATYTLTETAVAGYTLTSSEGAQGVITGDQESSASFENTYDAAGDMTLQVKKVMDPASLAIPEGVFAFELRSQDGTLLETVTAGTDGSASFSKISYDLSDVGQTYVYTVREVDHDYSLGADSTEEPVYVFDSTVYTVTVTVKDENGKGVLTAEPEYTADGEEAQGITFTNSSLVKVRVTKNWEGDALRQTQRPARITLNLFADGEMINSVTITAAQAIEGNSNQWAYTFNDLPEYKDGEKIVYTVTESPLAMYAAVVTAEDDYHYTITNTYAETSLSFGAVKTFKDHWTGEELPLEEGQFSFTIAGAVSGLSLPKNTTVTNDADGKIDFGEIVFTLSDLDLDEEGNYVSPTTVTYLVTEDIPEAATAYNVLEETNIRYDDTVQEIQVTLTWDAESGTLTAEAAQEPEDITFTNELWPYVGQLDLAARKLLDGETPQGAYQNGFTFTLSAEDGAPLMDEEAAPIDEADLTVTNDGEDVTFPTLHFFKEDIGKTYSYLITEAQDHPDRIVYDERPCPITVTVTADEETRVITAEAVYREEDAEALFENETLEKTGQVVLSAVKKLVDKALTEGQFTFELLDQDGNVLQTKTNAADGKIVFDALTYTDADLALEGETKLTYTIREKNDHQENYTYDTKARTITVTLTDGGAGVINAVADKTGSEVTFTNYYEKPTPTYDYKFSFTKLWQGGHEESIDWVFYHSDGTVLHKKFNKKVVSDYEWQYEAWFEADGDYYIIENVPAGYKVRYENVGKHAGETDRCYNGGTIINYKVPNTGDSANPLLWIGCMLLGIGIACGVIVYGKKRKT